MSLASVFNPKRVALVGASERPGKMGSLLWKNLSGFEGEVIPVTSSASQVSGVTAYPSLLEVEGDVDLAVLAVPAHVAPRIARQADAKGVGALVVLAGGFAETGPQGAALQEELAAAAGNVRVVGPNCLGVQNLALGLNASITGSARLEPGGVGLITQSGAYGMALHTRGEEDHIRFGKVYSSGNKMNIWDHEVVEYLRDDPHTQVICLLLESVPGGRQLAEAIRSTTPHKPVIVAKTGRSEAGSRAARSHTGALAADDIIFGAAMQQAGALVARSGLEMLDVAQVLSSQPHPPGNRAAIITNSGGMGVELVDLLSGVGVETPQLSAELTAHIAVRLPPFGSAGNPVDMTPVWARFCRALPMADRDPGSFGRGRFGHPHPVAKSRHGRRRSGGRAHHRQPVAHRRGEHPGVWMLGRSPLGSVQCRSSSGSGDPLPGVAGTHRPGRRACGGLRPESASAQSDGIGSLASAATAGARSSACPGRFPAPGGTWGRHRGNRSLPKRFPSARGGVHLARFGGDENLVIGGASHRDRGGPPGLVRSCADKRGFP